MSQQTIITKELDTHDLWDAWNNGTPLSLALEKFFDPKQVRRYRRLEKLCSIVSMSLRVSREMAKAESLLEFSRMVSQDNIKKVQPKRIAEFHKYQNAMTGALYRAISEGKFIAVGFSLPRSATDCPRLIPDDLLRSLSVLNEDTLKANGLKMNYIRLRRRQEMLPQPQPQPLPKELPPHDNITDAVVLSAGRPSTKSQIVAAYQSLNAEGKVDHSASKQECARNIRQFILSQNDGMSENTKGFNIQTIVRHIRDQFDADKGD